MVQHCILLWTLMWTVLWITLAWPCAVRGCPDSALALQACQLFRIPLVYNVMPQMFACTVTVVGLIYARHTTEVSGIMRPSVWIYKYLDSHAYTPGNLNLVSDHLTTYAAAHAVALQPALCQCGRHLEAQWMLQLCFNLLVIALPYWLFAFPVPFSASAGFDRYSFCTVRSFQILHTLTECIPWPTRTFNSGISRMQGIKQCTLGAGNSCTTG